MPPVHLSSGVVPPFVTSGSVYPHRTWVAFMMISVGVVCTVFDNPHFNVFGFAFSMGSAVVAAVQLILSEMVMTQGLKFDPVCAFVHVRAGGLRAS